MDVLCCFRLSGHKLLEVISLDRCSLQLVICEFWHVVLRLLLHPVWEERSFRRYKVDPLVGVITWNREKDGILKAERALSNETLQAVLGER